MTKTCFKCHVEKDINEFYSHPAMLDGHLNKCKECTRSDVRSNRCANVERYRAYDRQRGFRGGSKPRNENKTAWIERNPEKRAAHLAVEQALKDGRLVKPEVCEICDRSLPLAGHHTDYSEPLVVVWLCDGCHKDVHRKSNLAYLEFLRADEDYRKLYESKEITEEYRGDDASAREEDRAKEKMGI